MRGQAPSGDTFDSGDDDDDSGDDDDDDTPLVLVVKGDAEVTLEALRKDSEVLGVAGENPFT